MNKFIKKLKTKAISSVVAAVLITTISVALVGTTYFFSQGLLKGATAETFEVIDVFSNLIIVRNLGTRPIQNFTVLIDGKEIDAQIKEAPLEPGKVGTVELNTTGIQAGRHELVIMSKSMSQRWTWEFQYTSQTTTTTMFETGPLSIKSQSIIGKPMSALGEVVIYSDQYVYSWWNFSVADKISPGNATGVAYNGTHFWVINYSTSNTGSKIFRYNKTGYYDGWNITVPLGQTLLHGVEVNATHIGITNNGGTTKNVTFFDINTGNYITSFSVSSQVGTAIPTSLVFNGTYVWVLTSGTGNRRVYRYLSNGTYDKWNFTYDPVPGFTTVMGNGLAFNGTHFFVSDTSSNRRVFGYNSTGSYANWNFATNISTGNGELPYGLTYYQPERNFYTVDFKNNYVRRFIPNSTTISLNATLLAPDPSTCNETNPCVWKQYVNNSINASVTCIGGDCGTVQGLVRYRNDKTYDFKGITNPSSTHWAGYNRTYGIFGTIPLPDNYTQASTSNYQQINSSDDNRWFSSGSWKVAELETVAPIQMFKFKFNESLNDTDKISILWEGYGNGFISPGYVSLYLWNLSSLSWVQINSSSSSMTDFNLTYILNSSFSDFVDSSNYIRVATEGPNANYNQQISGELYTDYVKLDVSSWKEINTTVGATPFYTTDLNPKSCGSLSNGQTCQLNWTLNTTGEINSIYKIDVKFNSSISENLDNDTKDAFINITWLNQPPSWSQNSTSPTSGSFYQSGVNYGFQIKWTDPESGNGGISSVIFEWNNGTTKYNYTKYTTPSVNNDTNGIYWLNLTDLSAGNYYFKWYANDTGNTWSLSDSWFYVINKSSAPIHLFLNGTEIDKEYINNTAANFTVTLDIPSKTVYLNTNITGWNIQNSTTPLTNITILTASVFGTKYNITGYFLEDQNYSANSITNYVIIQNPLTVYGWLNVTMINPNPLIFNTTNPKTVWQNDNFNINATVICEGNTSAICGNVMGSARYNGNIISMYSSSKPFYIFSINAKTDTIYSNITNKAWKNLAPTIVGAASGTDTEFSTPEYNNINSSNDIRVSMGSDSSNYGGLHFSFDLGSYYQNINKIKFTFEGHVETVTPPPGGGTWYTSGKLYEYTDEGWTYVQDCGEIDVGDQNCTIEINSNISYYLDNNNKFHFGFVSPYKTGGIMVSANALGDFVKVEVTYGGTQNPSSCGSLSLGQSCQLNWTVNATGLDTDPNIWNIDVNVSSDKKSLGVNDNDTADAVVKINETIKPKWIEGTNSTDSTYAGMPTKFSLKWSDNFALSGYILSIDNCVGSFNNESWTNSGWEGYPSTGWSNVTKIINSTENCTIRWRYFANDTSNNWNVSQDYIFNTITSYLDVWLYLNFTQGDRIYNKSEVAYIYANCSGCFSGNSINLETNYTGTLSPISHYHNLTLNNDAYNFTNTGNLALGSYLIKASVSEMSKYAQKNYTLTVVDQMSPKYSSNSTNSTTAGNPTLFSIRWTDNNNLSKWLFCLDNCTGICVNDTQWQTFSSNPDWSNTTRVINSTPNCLIRWKIYANDTNNNWNVSENSFSTISQNPINIWNLVVRNYIDEQPIVQTMTGVRVLITVNVSGNINYVEGNFTWPNGTIVLQNLTFNETSKYTHNWTYTIPLSMPYSDSLPNASINITAYGYGFSNKTSTTLKILKTAELTILNNPVNFSIVNPGQQVNASQNQGWPLYVNVQGNTPLNLSQNASAYLVGRTNPNGKIKIENITWNTTISGQTLFTNLTTIYKFINETVPFFNQSIFYKLFVPSVEPQDYGGQIYICGMTERRC